MVWKRVRKPLQHFGQFGVVRGHQRKGCQLLRQLFARQGASGFSSSIRKGRVARICSTR